MAEPNKDFGDVLQNTDSPPISTDQTSSTQLAVFNQLFHETIVNEYSDLQLSPVEAGKLQKFMSQLRVGGSAGVRLVCHGDNCSYRKACPLWQTKQPPMTVPNSSNPGSTMTILPHKAPQGRACPIEQTVVLDVFTQLQTDPDIEISNPVHRSFITELCQIAALEWRCNMLLAADHHDVLQEVPAAISPTGDLYTKFEKNPILEALQWLGERRSRIFKELTVSPESKARRMALEGDNREKSLSRRQAAARAALKEAEKSETMAVPEHVKQDKDFLASENNTNGG